MQQGISGHESGQCPGPALETPDQVEKYILGTNDNQPKTPQWEEEICGMPAGLIKKLADRYGRNKPAALIPGLSIQRNIGGEEAMRMAMVLQAATGNRISRSILPAGSSRVIRQPPQ